MEHVKKGLHFFAMMSGLSHVFCCGIPTFMAFMTLGASLGIMGAFMPQIESFHEVMHEYEMVALGVSGAFLALGWIAEEISYRINCRDHGCQHSSCTPIKRRAHWILVGATCLFCLNVLFLMLEH